MLWNSRVPFTMTEPLVLVKKRTLLDVQFELQGGMSCPKLMAFDIFGLDNLNHWSPFSLIGCMGQFGILMTLRFGGPFCAFINKKELQNVTD